MKQFIMKCIEDEGGKLSIDASTDGFTHLEVIGFLDIKKHEILSTVYESTRITTLPMEEETK